MSDRFCPLKEDCQDPNCGHDKDTHHEGRYNCLAARCDCRSYKDRYAKAVTDNGPSTPRVAPVKPHADTTCQCKDCRDWVARKYWP